jgi:two-component sensor histidine kinase
MQLRPTNRPSVSRPKHFLLLLLLWAGSFSSQAEAIRPRLSPAGFDSLRARLQQSRPDTTRVLLLLQACYDLLLQYDDAGGIDLAPAQAYSRQAATLSRQLHFVDGQIGALYMQGEVQSYGEADTLGPGLVRQGLALSQRLGQRRLEAFGWLWLGEMYSDSPLVELPYFQRARELFRQLGDKTDEAFMLKCIADVHLQLGKPQQASAELRTVLALYRAAGHRQLHYTYDLLLATHRQMGDYKEALRYGLAAVESAQATRDTAIIGALYARLAMVHRELKQYPAALRYYEKAAANFQQTGHLLGAVSMAGAISRILLAQHRAPEALALLTRVARSNAAGPPSVTERLADYLVEVHSALGHYDQAEPYAQQLRDYLQSGKADAGEKSSIYLTLSKFYINTKRYAEARQAIRQAQGVRQSGSVLYLAQLQLLLFKADSAQGRFPAAIAHYQQYKLLTDSVFNESKNKQLASLEIQYDTHKKEQNIALLTKQTQMQQASIREQHFQRNALMVGTLLLVGLLGLGYNRYRLKQRSNRLLEAQQEEINHKNQSLQHLLGEKEALLTEKDWMLKEIHHRVKNNLQVISSLLNTQSDYLRDPTALAALRESQNRVHAMALIHQKLYQSTNLAGVNMADYIREIISHLQASFDHQYAIQTQLSVLPIELDAALATPLGLIINEALTNAFKYAFPQQPGIISIVLTESTAQHYQLTISDNGVGFPPDFDTEAGHTMGLTIMHGLSSQIDGTLRIFQDGGVRVSLKFEGPGE